MTQPSTTTTTTTTTSAENNQPPLQLRKKQQQKQQQLQKSKFVQVVTLFLFVYVFTQFRHPLKAYTGLEIKFKTPGVIREAIYSNNDTLSNNYLEEVQDDDVLVYNDDNEFTSTDINNGNAHRPVPPYVKVLQDYQRSHARVELLNELHNCEERTNHEEEDTIYDAVVHGWCPELQHRKFLIINTNDDDDDDENDDDDDDDDENDNNGCWSLDKLHSMIQQVAWAMVTNRTILAKRNYNENQEQQNTCDDDLSNNTLIQLEWASWVPDYTFWEHELELEKHDSIVSNVATSKLGNDEPQFAKLLKLSSQPLSTGYASTQFGHNKIMDLTTRPTPNTINPMDDAVVGTYGMLAQNLFNYDTTINNDKDDDNDDVDNVNDDETINNQQSFSIFIQHFDTSEPTLSSLACIQDLLEGLPRPCTIYLEDNDTPAYLKLEISDCKIVTDTNHIHFITKNVNWGMILNTNTIINDDDLFTKLLQEWMQYKMDMLYEMENFQVCYWNEITI